MYDHELMQQPLQGPMALWKVTCKGSNGFEIVTVAAYSTYAAYRKAPTAYLRSLYPASWAEVVGKPVVCGGR